MDIANQVKCTVCGEIPVKEIFHCKNLHIICGSCLASRNSCAKCNVSLIGDGNRLRHLAFESVLDALDLPCENKAFGCNALLRRGELKTHSLKECKFSGLVTQLCQQIGYKSCQFRCDTRQNELILEHFQKDHSATLIQSSSTSIQYTNFAKILNDSLRHIGPTAIIKRVGNEVTTSFLILPICSSTSMHLTKTCSWLVIFLGELPKDGTQFQAEFAIKNISAKSPVLQWTTIVTCLDNAVPFLENPPYSLPWSLLTENYCKNDDLTLEIRIQQVAAGPIKAKQSPSKIQTTNCIRLVMTGGEADADNQIVVFNRYNCDLCCKIPIKSRVYHCLQCKANCFSLCKDCFTPKTHACHIFAEIKTHEQIQLLRYETNGWKNQLLPALRMKGEIYDWIRGNNIFESSKTTCGSCKMNPVIGRRYKCLQCRNFDLCRKCADSGVHSQHLFAVIISPQQDNFINEISARSASPLIN